MNTDKIHCIYCKKEKTDKWNKEHIVANACGGKRKSNKIVCNECNNLFSQIDDKLPVSLNIIRNQLQIKTPSVAGLQPIDPEDDNTYELDKDSRMRVQNLKHTLTVAGEETTFEGRDLRKLLQDIIDFLNLQASNGVDVSKIKHRIHGDPEKAQIYAQMLIESPFFKSTNMGQGTLHRTPAPKVESQLGDMGGHTQFRAIAKMAFNCLAEVLGTEFALDSQFDKIRAYIHEGPSADEELIFPATWDFRNHYFVYPDELEFESGFEANFVNRIIIHCDEEQGEIIASVKLFRDFQIGVILSTDYQGETKCFGITNWPLIGGKQDQLIDYKDSMHPDSTRIEDCNFENNYEQFQIAVRNVFGASYHYRETLKFRKFLKSSLEIVDEKWEQQALHEEAENVAEIVNDYLWKNNPAGLNKTDTLKIKAQFNKYLRKDKLKHLSSEDVDKVCESLAEQYVDFYFADEETVNL